jgi:hypothetical protein
MQITLYKTNKGKTQYYSLDDRQSHLFSKHALTARWGTTPSGSREKQFVFETEEAKQEKIRELLKKKLKDYQVLYSYFKEQESGFALSFDRMQKTGATLEKQSYHAN